MAIDIDVMRAKEEKVRKFLLGLHYGVSYRLACKAIGKETVDQLVEAGTLENYAIGGNMDAVQLSKKGKLKLYGEDYVDIEALEAELVDLEGERGALVDEMDDIGYQIAQTRLKIKQLKLGGDGG